MSRKKDKLDPIYTTVEQDAKRIVLEWFELNHKQIDTDSLFLVWLGTFETGYRCMISSTTIDDLYFEINKNMKTGEMTCSCFRRFAYMARPAYS